MEFLARNPFLRLVIPLIAGILLQEHVHFAWSIPICLFLFSFLLFGIYGLLSVKYKFMLGWVPGIAITIAFISVGALLLKQKHEDKPELDTEQLTFSGQIINIPEEKKETRQLIIKTDQIFRDSLRETKRLKILAYLEKDKPIRPLKPGEHIIFQAYPNPIKNRGNPEEFDYKQYMAVQGIHYQVYIDKNSWQKLQTGDRLSVIALSNRLRLHLLNRLKEAGIGEEEYGIASALLLGYKDYLTPEVKARFSSSGATHILAVSGLHVGIIYLILHYLLIFLERHKHGKTIKILIILVGLTGYAFLTGLSPSVSRATLMFSVIAIGQILSRYSSIYNSLAFSAFVLLVINPLLLFSLSFQLSYLAVYSIVFFQPKFYKLIQLPLVPDKLWQWFTVALAAQVGIAPVIIHHFHLFSNLFWLTNFIAIPAAAIVIFTGMLYFIISPVLPILGEGLGKVLSFILSLLNQSTGFIQNLPYSTSESLYLHEVQILFYYLALVFISAWLIMKNSLHLKLALGIVITFLITDLLSQYNRHDQKELIIYNIPNSSVINYIEGENNLLFYNGNEKIINEIRRYTEEFWLSKGFKSHTAYKLPSIKKRKERAVLLYNNFIKHDGAKIGYICDKELIENLNPNTKLELDYLILAENVHISIQELRKYFDFEMVILDSSNSYYRREALASELKKEGIDYHSVQDEGAFRAIFD